MQTAKHFFSLKEKASHLTHLPNRYETSCGLQRRSHKNRNGSHLPPPCPPRLSSPWSPQLRADRLFTQKDPRNGKIPKNSSTVLCDNRTTRKQSQKPGEGAGSLPICVFGRHLCTSIRLKDSHTAEVRTPPRPRPQVPRPRVGGPTRSWPAPARPTSDNPALAAGEAPLPRTAPCCRLLCALQSRPGPALTEARRDAGGTGGREGESGARWRRRAAERLSGRGKPSAAAPGSAAGCDVAPPPPFP